MSARLKNLAKLGFGLSLLLIASLYLSFDHELYSKVYGKFTFYKSTVQPNNDLNSLCPNVLYNDFQNLTYPKQPDNTADQDVFQTSKQGCGFLQNNYSFLLNVNDFTKEERDNPIAYSILVHKNVHQLLLLLSAIYAPQNIYCIHVDLSTSDVFYNVTKQVQDCLPNVFLSTKREDVIYETFSRLQADLNCMEDLVNIPVNLYNWKHLINLCGQDFPLYTNLEIVRQLKALKGNNVIGGDGNPTGRIRLRTKYVHAIKEITPTDDKEITKQLVRTSTLKSPPPYNITLRKNLAYNVFSRRFLRWVLFESDKAKALLEWSRDTATPDEHYWLMLDALEEAPGRTGRISWGQISRYIVWKNKKRKCHGYIKHYSCVFGAGDIADMIRQPRVFFANKFDVTFDSLPLKCLRKRLDQRRTETNDELNPNIMPRSREKI